MLGIVPFTRSRFTRKPCARPQFIVNQGPGKEPWLNVDSLGVGLRPHEIPHEPTDPAVKHEAMMAQVIG